jgi:hypothetical protein
MKNIRFYLLGLSLLAIVGCGDYEEVVFDVNNGQTALGFETQLVGVSVPETGVTVSVGVEVTTVSSESRTFNVSVNAEDTTADSEDYSIAPIVVPAGEYIGTLTVDINWDTLEDFVTNILVLDLVTTEGQSIARNGSVSISFIREFVCPDLILNITFDQYAGETSWEITDASGAVVALGDGYGGESSYTEDLCLIDGDYTFTIFDSFGDGICCVYGSGSYEILLDGVVLFTGGEFGASDSQNFTVN